MAVFGKYRKKWCFLLAASMLSLLALVSAMSEDCFSTCDADAAGTCSNGEACNNIPMADMKSAKVTLASKEEVALSNRISCLCDRNNYSYHTIVLLTVMTECGEKYTVGLKKRT